MAFADWFRPRWRHSNPAIRILAVKTLTKPAILARVATCDADANVRRTAVEMLSNQAVLGEVAKADADEELRSLALGQVTEATILADIVQKGKPGDTRAAALARLTDATLLGEVARGNDDAELRRTATLRVTDSALLGEIATKDADVRVRQAAIPRVTDTAVLADIVMRETDPSMRQFAIDRIDLSLVTDELVLSEVARSHHGVASRKAATARINSSTVLMEIADGTDNKELRELAIRRVTDQSLLATAVIEECSSAMAILRIITDATQIGRIAKTAKSKEHREKAVARMQDEAALAEVANTDPEASVRAEAGKRLPPARWKDLLAILNAKKPAVPAAAPALLAEIARKAIDHEVRSAAVMRLDDGAVLAQVAERDSTESVRRDARQRITIVEREERAAQGSATGEDLRDLGLYYRIEDPRKAIRYLTEVIGRVAWLQGIPWRERITIYETRAAAHLAILQYDPAITDYDQAIEECQEPGFEYQTLRKRSACYKEMGMDDQAQADRAAAAKALQEYDARMKGP